MYKSSSEKSNIRFILLLHSYNNWDFFLVLYSHLIIQMGLNKVLVSFFIKWYT